MSNCATSSDQASKSSMRSTPQRRTWTVEEERTLINGLKELCAKGRRADNGTFRCGYLIELENYLKSVHPESGLRAVHITSKIKAWKKNYGTITMLKSRSGMGFQYGEGIIIVDDPKAWDDFIKIEPNAKGMNCKPWTFFEDWEEIFGKDRATGEFAEAPQDVVEEFERSKSDGLSNDMSLGFLVDVGSDDEEVAGHGTDGGPRRTEKTNGPSAYDGASQSGPSSYHGASQIGPSSYHGASQSEDNAPKQSQQHGKNSEESSSKVNDKEKSKKRKRNVEDDNETTLKDLVAVMKQFTCTLIDRLGERDEPEMRQQVLDILSSPEYELLYTAEQQVKAVVGITGDIKRMKMFLKMGELHRQTMVWMIINNTFPGI